ncbi:MAG: class I SAM-dependent methyltransferase [Chloroflexota bacterium]
MIPSLPADFGLTADDFARYRAGFPESLFDRLAAFGIGRPGQMVVDVGTGTGTLARGFARRGCRVTGIDPAEPLLEKARALDAVFGVQVDYRLGVAEASGLPEACAAVVSAGQCWHWFDRPHAAQEARRLLQPGGKIVIAHFDWLPLKGSLVEATEALILQHNPRWNLAGGCGIYPAWFSDLSEAGFTEIESFSYDVAASYTPLAWRGRIRASAGVGASLPPESVQRFDADLERLLAERFPGPELAVPHRVFAVLAVRP